MSWTSNGWGGYAVGLRSYFYCSSSDEDFYKVFDVVVIRSGDGKTFHPTPRRKIKISVECEFRAVVSALEIGEGQSLKFYPSGGRRKSNLPLGREPKTRRLDMD